MGVGRIASPPHRRGGATCGTHAGRSREPPPVLTIEKARDMNQILAALCLLATVCGPARGQEGEPPGATPAQPSEIDKLVEQGAVNVLEQRLRSGTTDELYKLATAAKNRARRERRPEERDKAFEDAEKRYLKLADLIGKSSAGDPAKRTMDQVRARSELAGMLLSAWSAGEMDRFELSDGKAVDRKVLAGRLQRAREQYLKAAELVNPLYEQIDAREDEFLALGIKDDIRRYKLDTDFNLGFANLYLGQVSEAAAERAASFNEAIKRFQALLDTGRVGAEMFQCHLGMGVALRELGRYDESERQFKLAMDEGSGPVVVAQARYEASRCLCLSGKFEEARALLAPLVERDPDSLPPAERAVKFYLNLGRLWEAKSYLLESAAVARTAGDSVARTAILNKARTARETGLTKMNRLAAMGGPWPAVVKLHVADAIKAGSDPAGMSPTELRFAAGKLTDEKKYEEALPLLREAATRAGVEAGLAGDILMDLALCHYQLDDLRSAAQTFDQLVAAYPKHEKAGTAAAYAYKCWAKVADETKNPADFGKLAAALRRLLDSFPQHEDRAAAEWFLPVALQAAGQYEEAARRFVAVPKDSPRWEEAQFRTAICGHLGVEAKRAVLQADAYRAAAVKAAGDLRTYAEAALARSSGADSPAAKFASEALASAGEMLVSAGVEQFADALKLLEDFEKRFPDSEVIGRVLAARIRAYRGQREFDQASRLLDQFLATVAPEKARSVLAGLASSMQAEIDDLQDSGRGADARALAGEAVAIFEQLLKSFAADAKRAADAELIKFGLARTLATAGQFERARQIVDELLNASPQNGNYQRLDAIVRTTMLSDGSPPAEVQAAQDAWGKLLRDPAMKKRAPQLYWEARYNWLALHARLGKAAEVESAIRQERVWFPDLGGPPWQEKLNALYQAVGGAPLQESAPASQPSSGPS